MMHQRLDLPCRKSRRFFSSWPWTTASSRKPRCFPQPAPGVSRRESRRSRREIPESSATPVAPASRSSGTNVFNSSTARRPVSKSTPAKVSPRSNASPCRLKFRWSSFANLLSRVILPDNIPDASGTRARMPTLRFCASAKNNSAGRCRKMLKMICTVCTLGEFDGLERFLDLFHAHAVMPQFAGFHQVVEDAENFRPVINLRGRTMQLQQVNRVRVQILQAALDPTP